MPPHYDRYLVNLELALKDVIDEGETGVDQHTDSGPAYSRSTGVDQLAVVSRSQCGSLHDDEEGNVPFPYHF